eukprot:320513-Chlamydomonas_euryale.AAC.3
MPTAACQRPHAHPNASRPVQLSLICGEATSMVLELLQSTPIAVHALTARAHARPTVPAQLSLVCGESPMVLELLQSDNGEVLLGARSSVARSDDMGRVLMPLEHGSACLPGLYGNDKNETFKYDGRKYGSFRLLAVAMRACVGGGVEQVEGVAPALSTQFAVKTQRALNDCRKAEYPHTADPLRCLKYIGEGVAKKLLELKKHMPRVPDQFASIRCVGDLRLLLDHAEKHREVENQVCAKAGGSRKDVHLEVLQPGAGSGRGRGEAQAGTERQLHWRPAPLGVACTDALRGGGAGAWRCGVHRPPPQKALATARLSTRSQSSPFRRSCKSCLACRASTSTSSCRCAQT